MAYQITAFGQSWNTEDLTIAEAEQLETELGCSYLLLNPLVVIRHYRAVLTVLLSREMDAAAAREKVESQTIATMGAVEKVNENLPDFYEDGIPKVVGGQLTGGSSPAPDGSGGPPT